MTDSLFTYPGGNTEEGEVRLVLGEGSSRLPGWRFFASESEQRVLVGTSHDCDWQVAAEGVAPHHLELVWVGDVLWVTPVGDGVGSVWVEGEPIQEWKRVDSDAELVFGAARVGIFGVSDLHGPTVISSVDQFAQGEPVAAEVAPPPAAKPRVSGFESIEPATVPVAMPPAMPARVPAPAPDKTAMTDLEDLRRWRDSCVDENRAGVPPFPPPPPTAAPPPVPTSASARDVRPARAPVAPAAPVSPPVVSSSQSRATPVPGAPSAALSPEDPRAAALGSAQAPPPSQKRLAAPPPVAPQPPRGSVEPKRTFMDATRDVFERVTDVVPTRAAIAALAVIFIVALLLVQDRVGAKNDAKHSESAPAASTPSVTKITPESSTPEVEPAESLDPDERVKEEGRAARLVAAGHLAEALPVYERLLANEPGNDAFAIAIRVIRAQLAAKCKAAGGAGGPSCLEEH